MRRLLFPRLVSGIGLLLLIIFVLIHTDFSASAQGTRIAYGDTVEGEITDDRLSENWTFVGSVNDVVAVTVSRLTGDLAPSIVLTDPSDALLLDMTWPDDTTDTFTFSVSLRTNGVHSLLIQGNETTGTYSVSLDLKPDGPSITERSIAYGRVVSGEITDSSFRALWEFDGFRNDIVDAEMSPVSGDLAASLTLIAPGGDIIATAQQDQSNSAAALQAVTLPATGTYTLVASRVGDNLGEAGSTQGSYELALVLRESGQSESAVLPGALRMGTKTRIRLTADAPTALFSVEARGILSVALESVAPLGAANIDVLTVDRVVLKHLSGILPLQSSVMVEDQDVVWIEVTTPQLLEGEPTDFVLTIDRFSSAEWLPEPLLWGRPQRVMIADPPRAVAWYFSAQAGDLVRITIDPTLPIPDGHVSVATPDGTIVLVRAINDGFVQPLVLSSSGLYEILVSSESGGGDYLISVDHTGAADLSFDQRPLPELQGPLLPGKANPISGALSPGGSHLWQVEITAPQRWRLHIEQANALVPVALAIEAPDGTTLGVTVTDNALGSAYLEAEFPYPGRYRAVVFDPTGEGNGAYTLWGTPVTGGNLSLGVPAKGVLDGDNSFNLWWLDLAPNVLLNARVDVLSGSTVPVLYLIKPDGSLLASNLGESDPGQLLGVPIISGGKYGVIAGGNTLGSRVVYKLLADVSIPFEVSAVPPPLSTPVPEFLAVSSPPTGAELAAVDISQQVTPRLDADLGILADARRVEPATLVRGEIASGYWHQAWSLSAEAGQTVGITATALDSVAEPSLLLIDSRGTILAEKFHPHETSAYLMYRFATPGNYYVVVSLEREGRYTLWVDTLAGIDESVSEVFDGQAITYGTTAQGEVAQPGDSSVFVFYGTVGDEIIVQTTSLQGDPRLRVTLLDETGSLLAAADTSNAAQATYRLEHELTQDGVYRLVVEADEESPLGRFALHLNLMSAASERHGDLLTQHSVAFLNSGDAVHRWLFNGLAGEKVSLLAEPLDEVPTPFVLQLADSTGHVFLEKRLDSTQSVWHLADVLLPRTGVYQAIVTGGRTQSGLYHVTLERGDSQASEGALRYGQTVSQVLTRENFLDVWTFAGSRDDVVTVLSRAVLGDPVSLNLQLRSHDGQVLATAGADDSGRRTFLNQVALPSDGYYSVVVGNVDSSFDGAAAYELTVLLENTQARSMGTVMNYGQQVEGVFSVEDAIDTWLFEGSEGDIIDVSVASGANSLPFQVSVISTDWHVAAAAQRAEVLVETQALEDGEAHITEFALPMSGVYALQVSASTAAWGRYQLSLRGQPAQFNRVNTLTPERRYEGQIAQVNPADVWTLAGERDDQITIEVTPASQSTLAPTLTLLNAEGNALASAESTVREPVRIESFRLPVTGTYAVRVGRTLGSHGHSEGRYTLEIHQSPAPQAPITRIAYDQLVNGGLSDETVSEWWNFVGQQGEVVYATAAATSGTLDPVLRLYNADGYLLAQGDDEQGIDAGLSFTLPADGVYEIEVGRYNGSAGTTRGNYVLVVKRAYRFEPIAPDHLLIYGDHVKGNVDTVSLSDQWVFSGEAGDVVHAELQFPLDDAPPSLILADPAGEALATGERDRDRSSIRSFTLPVSGFYVLEIRRPGDARARYTPYSLSLDLMQPAQDTVAQGGILIPSCTVTGRFYAAPDTHAWIFYGRAGEGVTLLLESLGGASPVQSMLVGPTGDTLLTGSSAASKLVFSPAGPLQLPVSGLYVVLVSAGEAAVGTDYRLTLKASGAAERAIQELSFFTDGFGTVTDIQPQQQWAFEGSLGQVISLRAASISGDLEPTLLLWSPEGRVIQEGVLEDTPNGKQASIDNFVVTEVGRYEVSLSRVGGVTGDSSGSYRLMLRQDAISSQAAAAVDIPFGVKIDSFTRTAAPYYYAFQGLTGDLIAISVKAISENNLPAVWVESESGYVFNLSLHQTPQEIDIPMFVVPGDGRYVVGLQSDETAHYELIVFRRTIETVSENPVRNLGRDQEFVDGILDPNQIARWAFEAEVDEVLSFVVDTTGTALRTDMVLVGPGGYVAGATEKVGEPVTTLGPVRFVDSGRYVLLVGSWLGSVGGSTGRYSVRIEEAGPDVSGSTGGYIQVPGATVTGGFTPTDPQDIWTFEGRMGEAVTILLDPITDTGTVTVELTDPAGNLIVTGDYEEIPQSIPVVLPFSGTYQLTLSGILEDDIPLDYRLSVRLTDSVPAGIGSTGHVQSLSYGERQTGHLGDGEWQQVWVFYGQAGHRVNVEVEAETVGFLPLVQLIGPDGRDIVVQASDAGGRVQLRNVFLPGDGFYGLVVGRSSSDTQQNPPVDYQIFLEALAPGAMYQGTLDEETYTRVTTDQPIHQWSVVPQVSGRFVIELTLLSPGAGLVMTVEAGDATLLGTATTDGATAASVPVYLAGGEAYAVTVATQLQTVDAAYSLRVLPSITRTSGAILDVGKPDVGRIDDSHASDQWQIDGLRAGPIRATVERFSGDLDLLVSLFDQDGILLRQVMGDEVGIASLDVELPSPGAYSLVVSRDGGGAGTTSGDYTVLVVQ
jgi:hypothetical protein